MKITRLTPPAEIIPLDLVAEYIGLDEDLDASQSKVLDSLIQTALCLGEEITGIVWAEAGYLIEFDAGVSDSFYLPVSPALELSRVYYTDNNGTEHHIPDTAYNFTPANMEFFSPWATVCGLDGWPSSWATLSLECKAGWTTDAFPESLRAWALIRIATLFDVRNDVAIGTNSANIPRDHAYALLDRYTVRNNPYVLG